jgi:hypothetical protein
MWLIHFPGVSEYLLYGSPYRIARALVKHGWLHPRHRVHKIVYSIV